MCLPVCIRAGFRLERLVFMFRQMRRFRQLLDDKLSADILTRSAVGVLALSGDDDYPYAVPVNYYYENGVIYIHGAVSGHKIDAIARNPKVSFCVVDENRNVPEEFTTYFRSVIAFGKARLVEDAEEKRLAAQKLADKFSPDEPAERRDAEIAREWKALGIIRIDIEHLSGKEAIELVRERKKAES